MNLKYLIITLKQESLTNWLPTLYPILERYPLPVECQPILGQYNNTKYSVLKKVDRLRNKN